VRLRAGVVAALCAGALVTGCSSTGSNVGLSATAAATLHSDVLALTRAAAAHNWAAADGALSQLRSDLSEAIAAGTVTAERAAELQTTIRSVAADLAARTGATATSSTPAPRSSTSRASSVQRSTPRKKTSTAPQPTRTSAIDGGGGGHGKKKKH
jgi:hypothetical protein